MTIPLLAASALRTKSSSWRQVSRVGYLGEKGARRQLRDVRGAVLVKDTCRQRAVRAQVAQACPRKGIAARPMDSCKRCDDKALVARRKRLGNRKIIEQCLLLRCYARLGTGLRAESLKIVIDTHRVATTAFPSSIRQLNCYCRPNRLPASKRDPPSRSSGTPSACWPSRPPRPADCPARHRRNRPGRSRRRCRARKRTYGAIRTGWRNVR